MLNKLNIMITIIILLFFLSYFINCSWFESIGIIFMMFALGFIKSAQSRQMQKYKDE